MHGRIEGCDEERVCRRKAVQSSGGGAITRSEGVGLQEEQSEEVEKVATAAAAAGAAKKRRYRNEGRNSWARKEGRASVRRGRTRRVEREVEAGGSKGVDKKRGQRDGAGMRRPPAATWRLRLVGMTATSEAMKQATGRCRDAEPTLSLRCARADWRAWTEAGAAVKHEPAIPPGPRQSSAPAQLPS